MLHDIIYTAQFFIYLVDQDDDWEESDFEDALSSPIVERKPTVEIDDETPQYCNIKIKQPSSKSEDKTPPLITSQKPNFSTFKSSSQTKNLVRSQDKHVIEVS